LSGAVTLITMNSLLAGHLHFTYDVLRYIYAMINWLFSLSTGHICIVGEFLTYSWAYFGIIVFSCTLI